MKYVLVLIGLFSFSMKMPQDIPGRINDIVPEAEESDMYIGNVSLNKTGITSSKKLVVAETSDYAVIRIKLVSADGRSLSNRKVQVFITGDVEKKSIKYPAEVITDKGGLAEFRVTSKKTGFVEFNFQYRGMDFKDKANLQFVPNIYFRDRNMMRNIKNVNMKNPVYDMYQDISPKIFWQSQYPEGWDDRIKKNNVTYKGIVIHHTEGILNHLVGDIERERRVRYLDYKEKYTACKKKYTGRPRHEIDDNYCNDEFNKYDLTFWDIPYNFFVGRYSRDAGKVYECRVLYKKPAHVGRGTGISETDQEMIGIVLAGNFTLEKLLPEQKRNLEALIIMLAYLYGIQIDREYPQGSEFLHDKNVTTFRSVSDGKPVKWLAPHRAFKNKPCPGQDVVDWLESVRPKIEKNLQRLRDED